MPLGLAALALLALHQGPAKTPAQTPNQGDVRKDGRPFIKAPVGEPATLAQIQAWDGWKLGKPLGFVDAGGLSLPIPSAPAVAADAVPFKLRVFVYARTEDDLAGGSDALRAPRAIEADGIKRIRAAVENVRAILRATTGGRVDLVPTVSVDEDTIRPSEVEGSLSLRMNGGKFDAEDGVDRGPFSGALVVVPGRSRLSNRASGRVSATPYAVLDYYSDGGEDGGTKLEAAMLGQIEALMVDRLREGGVAILDSGGVSSKDTWPDLGAWLRAEDLPLLRAGLDAPAPTLEAAARAGAVKPHTLPPSVNPSSEGPPYAGAQVYLEADPETKPGPEGNHGTVLRLRETGALRRSFLALPKVEIPAGRNLSFWARVGGLDSFAVDVYGNANVVWKGNEEFGSTERTIFGPTETERGAEFPLDGKWHRVVLAVPVDTSLMAILPSRPDEARRDLAYANVWLDDFQWTTDAPTAIVGGASADAFDRVKTARGGDLATYLADASPAVRLLALRRVTKDDAGLESTVIRLAATEITAENARAAIEALARLGTPTALAAIRGAIIRGPAEATRQAAAAALAATGDPAYIIPLVPLTQRAQWRTRLAAFEALGKYRQENAVRFRLSGTLQEIPELRYAALMPATTENPDERQKLLYTAINDPSDAIRAFAADRLLDAKEPAVRSEGLRGTADDSAWVRVLMQRALARRANPELKSGVLKGLADPVGMVRAEALRALAALGPPDPAEIAGALNDPHPDVLLALAELAKAGKVTLPEVTKARIAASPDARLKAVKE